MYGLKFLVNGLKHDRMCHSITHIAHPKLRAIQFSRARTFVYRRVITKPVAHNNNNNDDDSNWPRKIFSGIQPTGAMHLGNYLGAVKKWKELQASHEDVTFCIVDMHSITTPQDPVTLRENIFKLAATLFACGIDPNQSKIFVQSAVKEHSELCWLLGTVCTMARLGHLPQYKDKTQKLKEIPLGLFVYPVLQAADIMLYKTTHVPVGEDQIQHIQLTQHLAKTFNSRFGHTFPICHAIIDSKQVSRVRSLRDPSKKMSKSDPDPKSAIYITDEADVVVEKVKKAITDFCSDVSFDPEGRPGVSNLIAIHSHLSGQSIEQIVNEARQLDTGKYKLRVAEAINEYLNPIRKSIQQRLENRNELIHILESGAEKARNIAFDTVEEVKHKMGLGAPYLPLYLDTIKPYSMSNSNNKNNSNNGGMAGENTEKQQANAIGGQTSATKHILEVKLGTIDVSRKLSAVQKPSVPQQRLRVEKSLEPRRHPSAASTGRHVNIVSDITKELLNKGLLRRSAWSASRTTESENISTETREPLVRRVARCVEPPPTIVTPLAPISQPVMASDVNQLNRGGSDGHMLMTMTATSSVVATAPVTSTAIKTTTAATTATMMPAATTPPPATGATKSTALTPSSNAHVQSSSLSVLSKTTLPAWSSTSTKPTINSNGGECSAHNRSATSTITSQKFAKKPVQGVTSTSISTKFSKKPIQGARKTTLTRTTTVPFKRYLITTPLQSTSKKNMPQRLERKDKTRHLTRIIAYAALAIGAGFSGVFYFWRSVLKAFFDVKKSGGN